MSVSLTTGTGGNLGDSWEETYHRRCIRGHELPKHLTQTRDDTNVRQSEFGVCKEGDNTYLVGKYKH